MSEKSVFRIDGDFKSLAIVKSRFHKLTYEHIEHVLDQYKTVADRITKKKAYIVTMLYNATLEADSHMTNLYHSDRLGGRE